MVPGMADEQGEPGELTSRFQAFANTVDPQPSKAFPAGMVAAIAVLVVVVVAVVWLLIAN
jgi:hypothetical protein